MFFSQYFSLIKIKFSFPYIKAVISRAVASVCILKRCIQAHCWCDFICKTGASDLRILKFTFPHLSSSSGSDHCYSHHHHHESCCPPDDSTLQLLNSSHLHLSSQEPQSDGIFCGVDKAEHGTTHSMSMYIHIYIYFFFPDLLLDICFCLNKHICNLALISHDLLMFLLVTF